MPCFNASFHVNHNLTSEQVDLEVGERIQYKYVILEEQVRPILLRAAPQCLRAPSLHDRLPLSGSSSNPGCFGVAADVRARYISVGAWPASLGARVQPCSHVDGFADSRPYRSSQSADTLLMSRFRVNFI